MLATQIISRTRRVLGRMWHCARCSKPPVSVSSARRWRWGSVQHAPGPGPSERPTTAPGIVCATTPVAVLDTGARKRRLPHTDHRQAERHAGSPGAGADLCCPGGSPRSVSYPLRPRWRCLVPAGRCRVPRHRAMASPVGAVESAVLAETHALFDLAEGPLMRVKVFKVEPQQHLLVVTLHHIISDGASMGVLGREFAALYAAFQAGETLALPALTVQYADYAQWQRDWLAAGEMQRQLDYWRAQLGTEHPLLELATDHPRREGRATAKDAWTSPSIRRWRLACAAWPSAAS
ncbi:hypothetical protein EJJ20_26055 [Pseudomonas poae]|nr:hypothetical protein EJJ20_26055 [Pseudomonas poae]